MSVWAVNLIRLTYSELHCKVQVSSILYLAFLSGESVFDEATLFFLCSSCFGSRRCDCIRTNRGLLFRSQNATKC